MSDVNLAAAAQMTVTYTSTDTQMRTLSITPHKKSPGIQLAVFDCTDQSTVPAEIKLATGQVSDIQVLTPTSIQITPSTTGGLYTVNFTLYLWGPATIAADGSSYDFSISAPFANGSGGGCTVQFGVTDGKDYNKKIEDDGTTTSVQVFWPEQPLNIG